MMQVQRPLTLLDDVIVGFTYYYFTSLVVFLAVLFSQDFVKPPAWMKPADEDSLLAFCRHDGMNYRRILVDGYSYHPERRSLVAFFPLYPLLARGVMVVTDCTPELALLVVSNAALAAAFVLLHRYVRLRYADAPPMFPEYVLLAFGVFPMTFFFRMAYSESLFFVLVLLALLGMQQRWPLLLTTLIIGLATATRPVGVALIPAFAWHLWQTAHGRREFVLNAVMLLPCACGGLLAYMAFQHGAFDDPLAFARTQQHWRHPPGEVGFDKLTSLATFEPMWGIYDAESPRYWQRADGHANPCFSMALANPLYLLLAAAVIAVGAWKRWLGGVEIIVAVGLLAIPYLTRSYEMSMASFGRFVSVVPALYPVICQLLIRCPPGLRHGALLIAVLLLVAFTMLFAANYLVF